ncbi:DUF1934 domain-containing protein [Tepidibacillus fermentans]|uniref:Uncharacterized beta-barrel protein YwiB (DUF1934 family) n=1 Tax=Tepidibacillus fermentans TaxID=1281767 RepID=A0A4R3KFE0_9BACI|nr:DUF1934 domain-containing protein [Tepidibacillus fermentans]TCS82084.1 uncharacterized beta-barrel protein YwiB (DUF1934 family) [Tepidibacillus fermentans]
MKEIQIHIQTKIDYQTGEVEEWQHDYKGTLYLKNDQDIYLKYEDHQDQLGKTNTILKWKWSESPTKLSLLRQGETRSHQIFQEGKPHQSFYQTPYGTFAMEIHPLKVKIYSQTWEEGKIELEYDLSIGKQKVGRYQLMVHYRP